MEKLNVNAFLKSCSLMVGFMVSLLVATVAIFTLLTLGTESISVVTISVLVLSTLLSIACLSFLLKVVYNFFNVEKSEVIKK